MRKHGCPAYKYLKRLASASRCRWCGKRDHGGAAKRGSVASASAALGLALPAVSRARRGLKYLFFLIPVREKTLPASSHSLPSWACAEREESELGVRFCIQQSFEQREQSAANIRQQLKCGNKFLAFEVVGFGEGIEVPVIVCKMVKQFL